MKINWKQKLSSRKFWAACIAYATGVMSAFNLSDNVIIQATSIITAVGALAVYMLAEGITDAARAKKEDIAGE